MRKSLFAIIIAVVFTAGMLIGTTTLADAVSTNTDKQTLKKLQSIDKILSSTDKRLDKVLQGIPEPVGAPISDPVRAALMAVKADATKIVVRCDSRLGGTVPPPPSDGDGTSPP